MFSILEMQSPGGILQWASQKNLVKFLGKRLCQSFFFNKTCRIFNKAWSPATLFKKDFYPSVFGRICKIFQNGHVDI